MDIINHTFTIQWVGPLTYEQYRSYVKSPDTISPDWFNFYYFQSRKDARYHWHRYFGVHFEADGIDKRVNSDHEKIKNYKDDRDFSIWIGSLSNRKVQTPQNVDTIETLFIRAYSDSLDLNKDKKKSLPGESLGVINMWFDDKDNLKIYKREKPQGIHDVIMYYGEEGGNYLYKGNLTRSKITE